MLKHHNLIFEYLTCIQYLRIINVFLSSTTYKHLYINFFGTSVLIRYNLISRRFFS
jgi:hypothetical protein